MKTITNTLCALIVVLFVFFFSASNAQNVFTPQVLLELEYCRIIDLKPDGSELIYSQHFPRSPNEKPGPFKSEYFKLDLNSGRSTQLFNSDNKGSSPTYSPDGKMIAFIYKGEGDIRNVWAFSANGDELVQLTNAVNHVTSYKWRPDGTAIAYLAGDVETQREKELKERGYNFIFYEENLKNNNLFLSEFDPDFRLKKTKQLTKGKHIWDFVYAPDSKKIAYSSSNKNLIDYRYMFRKVFIINEKTGTIENELNNVGKLGNYEFSPDGNKLAYSSALNINDHAVSQAFTYSLTEKKTTNHTPKKFRGHISWVGWKNDFEVFCFSGEGMYPKLSEININNNNRNVLLDAKNSGIIFGTPLFTKDLSKFVFTGNTPADISNMYSWDGKGELKKISNLNPQLKNLQLARQEVFTYSARDGLEIEGVLMYPPEYDQEKKYPLILYVHGGPESHHSNGWLSRYSTPGQVMACKGYLVAYINYRASTGYGVEFGMEGFMDAAGSEFDDLADAIDYLVEEKSADPNRVGMAGGSYGGYASAWFATYYTKYVKAVCMFVGISNVLSKRGTTDIPYEELYVHSGKPLEEQWMTNLEQSPVYWAHQSKTATLIYGGANDTRVHPSQSLELYRRMKMNDHPAVRLVQYPGEGHGNRNQVGQIDVLYRQIDWLDWYVKDLKPLKGEMPPLDISDKYGLDWAVE